MNRKAIMILALLGGLGLAGPDAAETPPAAPAAIELPAPTGPFKIGTTRWHVTDTARPETFAAPGVPRQVEVLACIPRQPRIAASRRHICARGSTRCRPVSARRSAR
ncbi:MAG TPA: hypothetical protein VMW27_01745 [Thermoanaerobaculia bacterium]|nr:hypothetical protein [Thermoanaerobaculia bacterium]